MQTYGEMPEGLAIHVLTQLSSYLKSLHQLGWIHGDLQPSNLILANDEQRGTCLTVIDLGLARPTDGCSVEPAGSVTASGVPEYMSPEATRGIDQLTVASDIYALGCLGYAMIAGEPPIIGNNPLATCSKQRTQQPIALHELVPETDLQLSELIMRCLAKSPEDRPENCQLIEQELAAIAQRRPWSATESAAWWLCTEML